MSQLTLNADTSGYVTLSTAATVTSYTFQLPSAAPAANGAYLSATTGGVASWSTLGAATYATMVGYTTTATAAGTTTLTSSSTYNQFFTGTTTQTVQLPDVTTLATGWTFHISNNSTGNLTVNSSGGNLISTVLPGTSLQLVCILTTGTTAASWDYELIGFTTPTGTGNVVLATSPTLTTPALAGSSSGTVTLATAAVAGTYTYTFTNSGVNVNVGYLEVPQNSQTTSYQTVLADSGKHIYANGTSITVTIPANGTVAYPIGTVLTFVNINSTSLSIAITTDTMYLAGTGTTGTRALAQYGMATALKLTSTTWLISGTGLT